MIIATIRSLSGTDIATIIAREKTFSTGSLGFFGQGKLTLDGKRYQAQVQLVEIGSKPCTEPKPE